jgi:hypothetical protein
VLIERLKLARTPEGHELQAVVGGTPLWFRLVGERPPAERVDPFVPAALMAAMAADEPLEIDPASRVSSRLLLGATHAQEVLNSWNPALKKVPIRAEAAPVSQRAEGAAAFFSGGVDSLYTVLKHGSDIPHLILVHGLEITIDNESLFDQVLGATRRFAADTNREVVPIHTNLRSLADTHRLNNYLFHGAILAGAALVVGFGRTYIPAGRTYADLRPGGTHPLLDPLWSTEVVEVVEDGLERRRSEKIAALAKSEAALRVLRVCLENSSLYNCGRCEKCLRTMITLRLLGARAPSFPSPLSARAIAGIELNDESIAFLLDNLDLAEVVGEIEIARALRAALRRYRLLQLARDADDLLLGGLLRRARRLVRGAPPDPPLIGCLPERHGSRRGSN